jgi:predicted nucleotidyltransferase
MMADATIDGVEYARYYVCELEPGDVNSFGSVVRTVVVRISDTDTVVEFADGTRIRYGNPTTTMLIRL